MLPIMTRASETVLRMVPGTLREASYALGGEPVAHGARWWCCPTARSGLATAVVLAMARGIGETAPVLLVAGYARSVNANPFNGWQTSLPLYICNEIQSPEHGRPRPGLRRRLRAGRRWSWSCSPSPGGSAAARRAS